MTDASADTEAQPTEEEPEAPPPTRQELAQAMDDRKLRAEVRWWTNHASDDDQAEWLAVLQAEQESRQG